MDDKFDIQLKLDDLYTYQLKHRCSLQAALDATGISKSSWQNWPEIMREDAKAEVYQRIIKARSAEEAMLSEARAQDEMDITRMELKARRSAAEVTLNAIEAARDIVENSKSDFNKIAAANFVADVARHGLQPTKSGSKIVIENTAPTPPPASLQQSRSRPALPMPDAIPASEGVLEVRTQEKVTYLDGTTKTQDTLVKRDVIEG